MHNAQFERLSKAVQEVHVTGPETGRDLMSTNMYKNIFRNQRINPKRLVSMSSAFLIKNLRMHFAIIKFLSTSLFNPSFKNCQCQFEASSVIDFVYFTQSDCCPVTAKRKSIIRSWSPPISFVYYCMCVLSLLSQKRLEPFILSVHF